jgi:hypothetical protein
MFVTVYNLTRMMDDNIRYLNEAYETRENHPKEVFDNYVIKMNNKLQRQFEKLCEISCNERLIKRYKKKIEVAINQN